MALVFAAAAGTGAPVLAQSGAQRKDDEGDYNTNYYDTNGVHAKIR